jgi:phage terminase large subunit GpA-like protein
LLDEIDSGRWLEILIAGPSQSGKTLSGFVLPAVYHVAELAELYVLGIPDMRMANNKWKVDIEPVFRASPALERLLPDSGPGSRGGEVKDSITLKNGAMLKFMTAGGDDTSKAGFTARCVGVTEAARFSAVGESSVEADPLRQLRARQRSFDRDRRRLYVEGTVTIAEELPWNLREHSTQSRLLVPCPHCAVWVLPGRGELHGWQDARSELEAAEKASFFCPECGQAIEEAERRAAVRACKLVHAGQQIDPRGVITGEPPETTRLWFQWHAFHNLFVSTGDYGAEEWLAAQIPEETAERENAEKMLCQFVHSIPYQPPLLADAPLDARAVRSRTDAFPRGLLPDDTTHFTIGVDCGKWTSWWLALAFRASKQLHVVAYGALDVVTDEHRQDVNIALLNSLRAFRETIDVGWPQAGASTNRLPDAVWIDSGWLPKVIFAFTRESGSRYLASLGRGASQLDKYRYIHPKKLTNEVRKLGDQWHLRRNQGEKAFQVTFNADFYKQFVHERLSTAPGAPGAMSVSQAPANEHIKLSKHFTSESLRREFVPGKGLKEYWHKEGANHLLDCAAEACAAGDYSGFRLVDGDAPALAPPAQGWFGRQKARRRDGDA